MTGTSHDEHDFEEPTIMELLTMGNFDAAARRMYPGFEFPVRILDREDVDMIRVCLLPGRNLWREGDTFIVMDDDCFAAAVSERREALRMEGLIR